MCRSDGVRWTVWGVFAGFLRFKDADFGCARLWVGLLESLGMPRDHCAPERREIGCGLLVASVLHAASSISLIARRAPRAPRFSAY